MSGKGKRTIVVLLHVNFGLSLRDHQTKQLVSCTSRNRLDRCIALSCLYREQLGDIRQPAVDLRFRVNIC